MIKLTVKFKGNYNNTFHDVKFEYDWTVEGYVGDVNIKNGELYIRNYRIPIRKSLVASALNEFIMISKYNYGELDFFITSDGGYMVHRETSSNLPDRILSKFFGLTEEKKYSKPSLGDR